MGVIVIIQVFKRAIKFMFWDWSTLVLFELLYKFGAMIIAFPVLKAILEYAMQQVGLKYLSNQNVLLILKNPTAIFILIILVLLLAFYIYIEITAIIIYYDKGLKGEKISTGALFIQAIKRASYILKPQNILLVLLVIVIIPLTGFFFTTEFLSSFQIPEFILDFIYKSPILNLFYMIILVGLQFVAIRWIFSLHEVTLMKKTFKEARKVSSSMIKGQMMKAIIYYIIWSVAVIVLKWLSYGLIIGITLIVVKLFYNGSDIKRAFWFEYRALRQYGLFFDALIQFVLSFSFISALYYGLKNTDASVLHVPKIKKSKKDKGIGILKGIIILYLLAMYVDYNIDRDWFIGIKNINSDIKIVAHRGASLFAPENTIAALDEAVKSGANYAEIDVQQLKDGELILLHDTNFKRTTGQDKNVWQTTYEEVKTYDAGSLFHGKYQGEKVPTLEETIAYANDKINLMIELKLTGYEEGLEQKVINLIDKYKFKNQCMIVSMNYDLLTNIKQIDPSIKTGYITAVAYGNFEELGNVDAYSIEASFASEFTINVAKLQGKEVFVWTINNEKAMEDMIRLDVDGIITDNPYLANYVIDKKEEHPILEPIVNWFYD